MPFGRRLGLQPFRPQGRMGTFTELDWIIETQPEHYPI
jgi:hypothetical protein